MEVSKRNIYLVNMITKTLADNDCTVKDATDILSFAAREILANSTVKGSNIISCVED